MSSVWDDPDLEEATPLPGQDSGSESLSLPPEKLEALATQILEKVAREIVPELAERLVKEKLEELLREVEE